jgi:hypothetical protein
MRKFFLGAVLAIGLFSTQGCVTYRYPCHTYEVYEAPVYYEPIYTPIYTPVYYYYPVSYGGYHGGYNGGGGSSYHYSPRSHNFTVGTGSYSGHR